MNQSRAASLWPGGQAWEQAQSRAAAEAPGGLLLGSGGNYTLQGSNALLPLLWSQATTPGQAPRPLAELAGPLLVQNIVASLREQEPALAGLGRGRRFPHRLWRLLVGLKAAGLTPQHLQDLNGPGASRRRALASVWGAYEAELAARGLVDEADQLAAVVGHLDQGHSLPWLEEWKRLEVRQALWLRPAELRLLKALSRQLPVRVEFALAPPLSHGSGVFQLLEKTAQALERDGGDLEIVWRDLEGEGGPLARLALDCWRGGEGSYENEALELYRAPGAYAEVEAMVARARDLVDSGVPAHEILLVFPDLSIHGQMAEDVAQRLGLPLSFRRTEPLAAAPLVQAVVELLALPQRGYPRVELARAWDSPYLGPALARVLQVPRPREAARLLTQAGYVDARETPVRDWLLQAHGNSLALSDLAHACGTLTAWLAPLEQAQSLEQYVGRVKAMLERLSLGADLEPSAGRLAARVLARDLNAAQGLERAAQGLEQAAGQVGSKDKLSPGRLHALLRQALETQDAGWGAGARGGVRVLRLEDAQGLEPAYLLAGGLNQEDFPARPSDPRLLDSRERIALGRAAGLPVWRTDEEEFGGQVLRLLLLIGSARQGALLTCAATDLGGAARSPGLLLGQLALATGQEEALAMPLGGVYGETPPLSQCPEERSLWAALARAALRPVGQPPEEAAVAQATLYALTQVSEQAARWRSLAQRASCEQERSALEALGQDQRRALAGPFGGMLQSSSARELLQCLLAEPRRRRLSPTSLETYAACPMAWFLGWVLGLAEEEEPGWDLAARREGDWVHATLARFFTPSEFDPAWDETQQISRLRECLERAREELAQKGQGGHPLVQMARQGVLFSALSQVVAQEMAAMGDPRPSLVERDFGRDDDGLSLALDDGPPLSLRGRVDRLDQGEGSLRVVDYKHSGRADAAKQPVRAKDLAISAFQVPVYLAAARRLWGAPDDALSARVVPTRRRDKGVGLLDLEPRAALLAEDPEERRRLAQEGEPNLFNAVAELWGRLSQGDFLPTPEGGACDYCSLAGVCRARMDPAMALGDAP